MLSSLDAEEASAHDAYQYIGLPLPRRVCHLDWNYVYKIVDWETWRYFPDAEPEPRWEIGPWPIYGWRWEQFETCEIRWEATRTIRPHHHVTQTQCEWALRVGGVLVALYGSGAAARAAGAAMALTTGTSWDVHEVCKTEDIIVWPNSYHTRTI